MENYHDLLEHVFHHGVDELNERTGKVCRAISGYELKFNLGLGFPALTTRKIPFMAARGELLGFFRGYDNSEDFARLGCRFWEINANQTLEWLANKNRRGHGDLGRIYSKQWTEWTDRRIANSPAERDDLIARGYELELTDEKQGKYALLRKLNQLEECIKTILTNPSDRRIIINGWRPDEKDLTALVACHCMYIFHPVKSTGVMHLTMNLRSADLFLGTPANAITSALMLEIFCRLTGYKPGVLTMHLANAHIYADHFEQVKELVTREHFDQPTLQISDNVRKLGSVDEVPGCLTRIEPADLTLLNYESHGVLTGPMAA